MTTPPRTSPRHHCNIEVRLIDTGIGMTKEELVDCLGTIAQSGTSKFLKALKENQDLGADNGLIGQFNVGFYSAFLVADKVVVSTKSPRSDKQYIWEAAVDSSSYVNREEANPEKILKRGTEITLYLRICGDEIKSDGHSEPFVACKVAISVHSYCVELATSMNEAK